MNWLIAALIVFAILYIIGSVSENKKKQSTPTSSLKVTAQLTTEGTDGDTYRDRYVTYIAGITYRCDDSDIGGYYGAIIPEPTIEHDPNAMAVYAGPKIVGYIGKENLRDYRKWSGANPCPCIVWIYKEDGKLRGRVRVVYPRNANFIREELEAFSDWLRGEFGSKYVPLNKDFLELSDPEKTTD